MDWNPDNKYAVGVLASATFLGNLPLSDASQFEAEADPSEYLAANYHAKENIVAGYVRRSEEHTSELQSLMRISYAVFCLKKKNKQNCTYKAEIARIVYR